MMATDRAKLECANIEMSLICFQDWTLMASLEAVGYILN